MLARVFMSMAVDLCGDRSVLGLVFGSVARCEANNDLDLLFVLGDDSASVWHRYERIEIEETSVDLNVASEAWLRSGSDDLEWSYCIGESFVLGATDSRLEQIWRERIVHAWSGGIRTMRVKSHRAIAAQLGAASGVAEGFAAPLLARLLAHEQTRSIAMSLVERFGTRVFSHRSFISELRHAAARAKIDSSLAEAMVAGLISREGGLAQAEQDYVRVRRAISEVLRGPFTEICAYDAGATRETRMKVLAEAAVDSNKAATLEGCLSSVGGEELFASSPILRKALDGAMTASVASESTFLACIRKATMLRSKAHRAMVVPTKDAVPGTRWTDLVDGRLKVILSSGGCRTPSCTFCVLPFYGRSVASTTAPSDVVRGLVEEHRPRELAIYNDGSLLNPAEMPREELWRMCRVVQGADIESLMVESIPRFVTREVVHKMRFFSKAEITVGMGFQCAGNWAASGVLQRPDPDALFDRAIDALHCEHAKARLYLLWGYPSFESRVWEDLLVSSIRWCRLRGVDRVTICPYVEYDSIAREERVSGSLCRLRKLLSSHVHSGRTTVDVALPDRPSCGIEYRDDGCVACWEALRGGDFTGFGCRNRGGRTSSRSSGASTRQPAP